MTSNIQIQLISQRDIDSVWEKSCYYISRALTYARGERTLDDVLFDCKRGQLLLWLVIDDKTIVGAFTSYIAKYPQYRVCVMDAGGSEPNIDVWPTAFQILGKYARMSGCERLVVKGRGGWERVLPRLGFEKDHVVMSVSTEEF